ncbi:MAG: lysylphosphatidylglycerol synthase transmembrane domain-containing protein [Actinomycetes bacterium]
MAASACALLVAWGLAAALELPIADEQGPQDWARSLAVSLRQGLPVHSSPWAWVGLSLIGLLAGVHYLLAAVVLRAAAGHRAVPLGAGFLAQLAATAANRMTPVGLGGAAVNTRFLFCRGLPPAGAAGTVAAMGVLGLVADALLALSLWVVGGAVGIPGSRGEVSRLAHEVTATATRIGHGPRWLVALVGAAALITAVVHLKRRGSRVPGPERALRTALRHAGGLARRPIDLAVLLLASAGTTAVLAAAMVVSVRTVGAGAAAGVGAVLMAYLVGAAAGNIVPVPAGIASTEAALATALIAAGVSAVHAVSAVVLYRTITFWGPVPAGLLAARSLRRRRLL